MNGIATSRPKCHSVAPSPWAKSVNGAPPIVVAHTAPKTHDIVTCPIARRRARGARSSRLWIGPIADAGKAWLIATGLIGRLNA